MKYTIGTRGSLLALTQCNQVKDQLVSALGDQFELKIIKTQGDQIQDKPLWQVDGKDFFTKELDQALLQSEVDLVVHSYKDLGTDRPQGIAPALLLKRSYPHDILLIKKSTIDQLYDLKKFVVGTSSPRRIAAVTRHLKKFIPNGSELELSCEVLRGNVNTRIEKLLSGQYHAIVLAMSGLERLALTESSRKELERLCENLNYMILPLSVFPSAAGQGTLAIECRSSDKDLIEKLKRLEDPLSAKCSRLEKERFKSYGGGCHLGVGIHSYSVDGMIGLIESGEHQEQVISFSKLLIELPEKPMGEVFIGMPTHKSRWEDILSDEILIKKDLNPETIPANGHTLVTSSYAIDSALKVEHKSLWASGMRTGRRLALEGRWINGMGDLFGEQELSEFKNSALLSLFHPDLNQAWNVLTNDKSQSDLGPTVPVYTREVKLPSPGQIDTMKKVSVFYWTSYHQYCVYMELFPFINDKMHCCGIGKTYRNFKNNNIKIHPFANINHFEKWCSQGVQESGND